MSFIVPRSAFGGLWRLFGALGCPVIRSAVQRRKSHPIQRSMPGSIINSNRFL
jgi:hypothetical protein